MALVLKDRVKETTTTTGTGTITLAGASIGYQSFSAIGNANTTYYCIAGQGTTEWEVGIGTYTSSGATLSRDTILASSNSGSVVTFSAGTKDVFVVYPAGKSVNQNASGNVEFGDGTVSAPSISFTSDTNTGLYRIGADNLGVAVNGTKILDVAATGVTITGKANATEFNGPIGNTTLNSGAFTTVSASGTITANNAAALTATNGYLTLTRTTNDTSSLAHALFYRGSGAGAFGGIYTVGDAANGVASLNLNINGTNIASVSSTGLSVTGTLSATGVATFAAGTAALPSITTTGDTNTGVYFPAADEVGITAGGTQRGAFSSTGLSVTGALSCSTNLTVTGGTVTTGSTTALSLATSGGTQVQVTNTASAVNYLSLTGSITGNPIEISMNGSDTNVGMRVASRGNASVSIYTGHTGTAFSGAAQVVIGHTASANRYITLTGSNGGNPTIGTSAGDLAISTGLAVTGTLSATGVATFAAGTVALPSITTSGDTNTGVYFPAADTVGITAGGTQRGAFSSTGLAVTGTITSTGNVTVTGASSTGGAATAYLGTVSTGLLLNTPTGQFGSLASGNNAVVQWQTGAVSITGTLSTTGVATFPAGTVALPSITTSGDTNTGVYFPAADTIAFTEGGAEAMRIDSAGRLLIAFSTSNAAFGGKLQYEDTNTSASLVRYSTSAGGAPSLYMARSKGAAVGTNTIVASGDTLGGIVFSGANGTGYSDAAYIQCFVDGTPGASADMPGRLVFSTSSDGSATPAERMRIDSSGNVGIGTNTPSTYGKFSAVSASPAIYRFMHSGNGGSDSVTLSLGSDNSSYLSSHAILLATQNGGVTGYLLDISSSGTNSRLTLQTSGTNSYLGFNTSGSERMRINSSGNVGIGTASPGAKLDVQGGQGGISNPANGTVNVVDTTSAAQGVGGQIVFRGNYTGTTATQYGSITAYKESATVDGTQYGASLIFNTRTQGGSNTEKMRIDSSGNVLVGKASATANGGDVQVSSGITFPATQVSKSDANTLDDYEEGTWTPSIGGTATYTTQLGFYTKIGRQVTITFDLNILVLGTGSTSSISGAPFTPAAGGNYYTGSVFWENIASSQISVGTFIQGTTGTIFFYTRSTAGTSVVNASAIIGSGTILRCTMTYFI